MRQMIAQLLFQAGRMADRMARTMVYVAAGSRRLEEIQTDKQFVWDAFYRSYPSHQSQLLPWEKEFVDRYVPPGADVLLIGCGSGRDLLPLVERGCQVTGIDPSREGLAIAERLLHARGLSATLTHGFFENLEITHTFNVVIFSYYCYGEMPMASRRIAALTKAAALVKPGGHVVVSHAAGIGRPRTMLVRLGQVAGTLARSDWRLEPGDFVSDSRQRSQSFSFTHEFENGELEREAAAANLRVVFRLVAEDMTTVAVLTRV
jgi:SAM-dependent methyltransferase